MGTSLQTDRTLVLELEGELSRTAAAAAEGSSITWKPPSGAHRSASSTPPDPICREVNSADNNCLSLKDQVLRTTHDDLEDTVVLLRDVLLAVQYRMAAKSCLEQSLKVILNRLQAMG